MSFKIIILGSLLMFLSSCYIAAPMAIAKEPENFVVQLTRSGENHGHRVAFLQIDKVLDTLGEDRVNFTVVAYESGIYSLLSENKETSQLLTKLANRGVVFKACQISMRANDLSEDDFSMEVEYVPAGAPEVIKLQLEGYKYWKI